ncbi:RpiR family transcriptional regulator (plasmid) [Rhizobium laguerreae]|uniref:RpiR family transcriptional regulator n=1 Tax=Rhizobium laguerreae TaxID=1076926 RepID=UPI001E4C7D56|nr:RpiR family transcriptional regulator [Rhizobium laguerreae]UFW67474.1 RpiR family transcriptional regulator [Rhizobium laguerreae]
MSQHIRNLCSPPASFEELKSAIACRHVTFPLRVENVAKRVLAKPELMAFGSATSIADDCGVSVSTVMRFVAHIGFHEIAQARAIFRNELRRRLAVLLPESGTKNESDE